MKITRVFFLFLVFFTFLSSHTQAQATLQSQINAVPEHGVLKIPGGIYQEAIVLSKSIAIEGTGQVTIRSCGQNPVITIQNQGVVLKHVKVEQCGTRKDLEAIYVTGENHRIEDIQIETKQFGIKFDKASDIVVTNSSIQGNQNGNGIDLWKSSRNTIHNVKINGVRDGIYMERSDFNKLTQNAIQNSRYGIHVMFSNDITVRNNVSRDNITGAMVMETKGTTIEENEFIFNNRNVHAQGLLLYDAEETAVIHNYIAYNRVGIYVENTAGNRIFNNELRGNFIGMQFKNANGNSVSHNTFLGNVNESQAIDSTRNNIIHNYWDTALKLDTGGKGTSSIPYRADPFFLTLTRDVPEYQLFFQSPGMVVLQKLLKSPEEQVFIDDAPAMKATGWDEKTGSSSSMPIFMLSASMLAISSILFIIGRKRT
ncbi:right-handed parallel beta-helix repeat-containing protein [Bacillus sp. 165]|uniref:right-handed parallel beta-helix repeat-containing protein n=1 Tax=Bacillus sp. 165 TaxID=1529117 RepID=UPI001ADB3484|nr:right-handed parallel beta-helix repeat-containing protein [Bacillus sp. 165]MBO9129379.1 right-handed parallel beta-helix repeat-containing protein [Bacillus sp. 165]